MNQKTTSKRIADYIIPDRIDIQVEVTPVSVNDLAHMPAGESSEQIRQRVIAARELQTERYKQLKGIHCNAQMTRALLEQYARLDEEASQVLTRAMNRMNLSARAYDRILRVSRTIADLEASPHIQAKHVKEAVGYRNLDRADWGE